MGASVPVEFQLLVAAVIIGFVYIFAASAAGATGERNLRWLSGPRDEDLPVGVLAQRLRRAQANFFETFPLLVAALVGCAAAGKLGGPLTVYGVGTYVIARAIYLPLYAIGTPLRSLVWGVSFFAIVAIVVAFFR